MKPGVADKVRGFYRAHKRMPSITELMALLKLSSRSSAFYVANQLIEGGIVEKDTTGKLIPAAGLYSAPLLGHIRAGFAAPAEEELADTITVGEYLLPHPDASYLLTVEGDSMVDAGIQPGDMVVFERTNNVQVNDIVVALTEDGYTLKYLRRKNGRLCLEAANDAYPDIHPREGEVIVESGLDVQDVLAGAAGAGPPPCSPPAHTRAPSCTSMRIPSSLRLSSRSTIRCAAK